eukprot:scaffold259046_cov33-Tisochrysis_lutea.AAC.1
MGYGTPSSGNKVKKARGFVFGTRVFSALSQPITDAPLLSQETTRIFSLSFSSPRPSSITLLEAET